MIQAWHDLMNSPEKKSQEVASVSLPYAIILQQAKNVPKKLSSFLTRIEIKVQIIMITILKQHHQLHCLNVYPWLKDNINKIFNYTQIAEIALLLFYDLHHNEISRHLSQAITWVKHFSKQRQETFFPLFDQWLDITNDNASSLSYAQRLLLMARHKIKGKDSCNRALLKWPQVTTNKCRWRRVARWNILPEESEQWL